MRTPPSTSVPINVASATSSAPMPRWAIRNAPWAVVQIALLTVSDPPLAAPSEPRVALALGESDGQLGSRPFRSLLGGALWHLVQSDPTVDDRPSGVLVAANNFGSFVRANRVTGPQAGRPAYGLRELRRFA